jgi:hypothetical protein
MITIGEDLGLNKLTYRSIVEPLGGFNVTASIAALQRLQAGLITSQHP